MATTPQAKTKSPTIRRILREAAELSAAPSPDYTAEPIESDLFEWHFTLRGPPHSAYSEGLYHGRIVLPPTYPLRPPSFRFTTPNGRFEANREICLSISGHHEETWQPAWGIRTALVALRSFMETDAQGQLGGLETTEEVRKTLAGESGSFQCPICGRSNAQIIRETETRHAKQSPSVATDQVVLPGNLQMNWKDELRPDKPSDTKHRTAEPSPVGRAIETQDAAPGQPAETSTSVLIQQAPDFRVSTSSGTEGAVCRQTHNGIAPQGDTQARTQQAQLRQHWAAQGVRGTEALPNWIDRAIVVLIVLLAGLLLKVMFEF